VVFDALGVLAGGGFRDAEGPKEGDDHLVALAGFCGEAAAGGCQQDAAARLRTHKPLALQALNHPHNRHMRHTQAARDVCRTGPAAPVNKIGDCLDVILRALLRVDLARVSLDGCRFGSPGMAGAGRSRGHGTHDGRKNSH
jgi:hypothetical protein